MEVGGWRWESRCEQACERVLSWRGSNGPPPPIPPLPLLRHSTSVEWLEWWKGWLQMERRLPTLECPRSGKGAAMWMGVIGGGGGVCVSMDI